MSLSEDEYNNIEELTTAKIEAISLEVYNKIIEYIKEGLTPQKAINKALSGFNGEYRKLLENGINAILKIEVGGSTNTELRQYVIGKVQLSDKLYIQSKQVAATTKQVITDYLKYEHDVRKLALALFEGYGFKESEVLVPKVTLPKYMQDAALENAVNAVLKRAQKKAMGLSTPALKASYLGAINAILNGKGQKVRDKALKIAIYERYRYFAERIAQYEMRRAHNDQLAREIMEAKHIEYVQIKLNGSHKKRDMCDLYAERNLYKLGPGVYPKAEAPRPPFHPFCKCYVLGRMNLFNVKQPVKREDANTQAYLSTLPASVAAQIMGSNSKLQAVLNGFNPDIIFNSGRPEEYWIRTLSEVK